MHARYDKSTLSDDLIFREAPPMVGGRANWNGTSADAGVQASSVNNFQGRYIIRHYWEGAVACTNPQFGEWGGPPSGSVDEEGRMKAQAARGLASAKRGQMKLSKVVRSPVPTLGIAGQAPPHHRGNTQ